MQPDDTLCYCFHVTKRKVMNFIRVERPRRASQITACGGAGTGCGWCVPFLKKCFDQAQHGQHSTTAAGDDLTPEEYARRRAEYIRAGRGNPPPGAIPLPPEADDRDQSSPGQPRET